MTEQEKADLKAEILEELQDKFKGVAIREDTQGILSEPRNKWFRAPIEKGRITKSIMYKLFGTCTYWVVWETIRKLTCIICGCGYVRQLKDTEMANEVAETLCQTVYDLRKRVLDSEKHNPV